VERLRGIKTLGDWDWLEFAAGLPSSGNQFIAQTASQKLMTGRYIVTGICGTNAATTAGTVTLYDGQDASGEIIATKNVAASSDFILAIPSRGVMTEIGVFLGIVTANITGTVWAIPLTRYNLTPPGQ
jgi:hypothetical protein